MKYRVLYLFHSVRLLLLEIKRLDLPATAPAPQLYHWLHYAPATNQLTHLDFVALRSAPPFETREFRQGNLEFSSIEGVFRPAGTAEAIALRREFLLELPPKLAEQLGQL